MIEIKKTNFSDLEKIVEAHLVCFPDSFSSSLGKKLLKKYYSFFLSSNKDLFLTLTDNGMVVGFVMGYFCENNNNSRLFIKKHFIAFALRYLYSLFIRFDKRAWKKLFSRKEKIVFYNCPQFKKNETGDLLSICVLPKYRGTGCAELLLESFVSILMKKRMNYCILSTTCDNLRAQKFYQKNGFLIGSITNKSIHYFKRLDAE